MGEDYNESLEGELPRRNWGNIILISVLVALGWLIFELTAQPALGAVIVCAKFGWNDIWTARWLRHNDPDRRRGVACFWLFVASGLWKMALTAFVLMCTYPILDAIFNVQPPQPGGGPRAPILEAFIAVAITWMVGFGLSGLATLRALWLSLRFGIKLWLDPQVHQARRANYWPPYGTRPTRNRAGMLVITTLFIICFPTMLAAVIAVASQMGQGQQELFSIGFSAVVILGPILMLVVRDLLAKRMLARRPTECWGDGESEWADPTSDAVS